MSNQSTQFKRKTYSKGFSCHKELDEFIQNSLDKYYFVDPKEEMYEATGIYSKFIVSNKSAIPDLVIWNKKFNKNECFYDAKTKNYNSFPRHKFILKAKPPNTSQGNLTNTRNESNSNKVVQKTDSLNHQLDKKIDFKTEEGFDDKFDNEDIQWEDIDVKEFENTKVKFQALPGAKENLEVKEIVNKNPQIKGPETTEKNYLQDLIKDTNEVSDDEEDDIILNKLMEKNMTLNMQSNYTKINSNNILQEKSNIQFDNYYGGDSNKDENREKIINNHSQDLPPPKSLEKNSLFENDFSMLFRNEGTNSNLHNNLNNNMVNINNISGINSNIYDANSRTNNKSSHNLINQKLLEELIINKSLSDINFGREKELTPRNHTHKVNANNDVFQENDIRNYQKNMLPQMDLRRNLSHKQMNMIPVGIGQIPFQMPQPGFFFPMSNMQFSPRQNEENISSNNNFNEDAENSNSISNLLENPIYILEKNFTQKGWFLMSANNKILGHLNSLELFEYLESKINDSGNFDGIWITDYETDIYFTPTNLYELLKENIPKIFEKIKKSKKSFNSNMNVNYNNPLTQKMIQMNNLYGNMPKPMEQELNKSPGQNMMNMNMPFPDPRMNIHYSNTPKSNSSNNFNNFPKDRVGAPLNMNINLQVVKNNINYNNFTYGNTLPNQKMNQIYNPDLLLLKSNSNKNLQQNQLYNDTDNPSQNVNINMKKNSNINNIQKKK